MVTLTEAAALLYEVLDADVTLRGSNMLNGTNRIQNHPIRPVQKNNPHLTIATRTDGKSESGTTNFFARLRLYLDNFGEKTADVVRGGAIQERLHELLDAKQLTHEGVTCRRCVSDNDSGPHVDAEFIGEAVWIFDYNLIGVVKT